MSLPTDLKLIIISYIPLKKLQIWEESNPSLFTSSFTNQLFYNKYNLFITDLTNFLTPFELMSYLAMNMGDIGYNGQFYLPLDVLICYSIINKDLDLLNYYFLRFFNKATNPKDILYNLDTKDILYNLGAKAVGLVDISRIIGYLAQEYFPLSIPLLQDYGFYIKNKQLNNVALLDYLVDIDFDTVKRHTADINNALFPAFDISQVLTRLYDNSLIPKKLIANANKMLKLLTTANIFAKSVEFDEYIDVLKILTNNDVDPSKFISLDPMARPRSRAVNFLVLVASVLNGPICRRLSALSRSNQLRSQAIIPIVSEVLYDIDFRIVNDSYWLVSSKIILFSIYLAKEQYRYMLKNNTDINTLVNRNNQLNVYETYIEINNYKDGEINKPQIYDAETAVRLNGIADIYNHGVIDVRPYLAPTTNFSKNLMIQFGLL